MMPLVIRRRVVDAAAATWPAELHPLLARVYAARGLAPIDLVHSRLADLAPPSAIGGVARACEILTAALEANQSLCVVGDFDADGATGTAVAVRGLRLLGAARVSYRVPNRLREGYGLSAALVESLAADAPDVIITVDNGIACHGGVAAAKARGMRVIVTDHHLPGATLPAADAIVNPNAHGIEACAHAPTLCADCTALIDANAVFPSRALAGVGVMFYLLLALRAHLRERGAFARRREPDLSGLLDLVALGTVADLVPLDANNRILIAAGLRRIRAGRACAGVAALYRAAGRDVERAVAADLGFALGPRINAAGRLDDMRVGIECLLTDEPSRADELATQLSAINAQRQELQSAMVEQADAKIAEFLARHRADALPHGIVLYDAGWHPGIVGLVASKLKERLHRPVVACARADLDAADGVIDAHAMELRGSARSIAGFHLRDALAEIDAVCPGLIVRFGGHAMAAGLTLAPANLARFAAEFDAVARRRLSAEALERFAWSDGELSRDDFTLETARELRYAGPWGQEFAEPTFDNSFEVESWRAVGERHLRLQLKPYDDAVSVEAMLFDALDFMPPPSRVRALYQLDVDHWNGRERLRLLLRHLEPL